MRLYQQANYSHVNAPAADVSEKYNFANSNNIITQVEKHGLKLQGTSWAGVRKNKAARAGQQKHLMVFSFNPGGEGLQLLITNGHEGRTALSFDLGYFRAACANGMICGKTVFNERIVHKGSKDIHESIEQALEKSVLVDEQIDMMKSVEASNDMRIALGRSLAALRGNLDIIPSSLRAQRAEDTGMDMWTKFNMCQEYAIKGGFRYRKALPGVTLDANGRANPLRRKDYQIRKARPVGAIDDVKRINRELWDTAVELVTV